MLLFKGIERDPKYGALTMYSVYEGYITGNKVKGPYFGSPNLLLGGLQVSGSLLEVRVYKVRFMGIRL